MKRIVLIFMITLVASSGCSTIKDQYKKIFGSDEGASAQELAWDGMDAYENGNYSKAIEKFQKIKDYYPFSKYAILAELKIADSHYKKEEYEDAIFAYENFEQLHPRNEAIPYVIYQIGRCYYDQIDSPDRDQTSARKALETFQRLIEQYPKDQYAVRAREHIDRCEKSLAGNAYIIGEFYYRTKHYKAALHRFESIISDYPDVGYHKLALDSIAKCEVAIAEEESEETEVAEEVKESE
jgi:outer membrane protein assembly factor BamD